jgi:hypothetical protein
MRTINESIIHRIEIYQEGIKKAELEKDISSQIYLRGALEELKFIEQKLIDQSQEPKQREVSEFDWNELRDSFFFNCTTFKEAKKNNTLCRVNIAPHDLFEWFKDNLFKSKTNNE